MWISLTHYLIKKYSFIQNSFIHSLKINIKKILRTPEERFANLPDYNFPPNYMVIGEGLRMHFVDEGAEDALVVLLLHGEPSWSYLYRKMIPILIKNGFRMIAPDLIGFGKPDKLTDMNKCSYQSHIDWVSYLVSSLDLKDIMLFCQDWGGLIGLRMAAETPNRFAKIVVSNTMLPTGEHRMPDTFLQWREFSQSSPEFDIGGVINMGTISDLSEEVLAAYNARFPAEKYKAGAK